MFGNDPNNTTMKPHPTILHVDVDSFFASVEQVLNPALRGKPVCVGGNADDRSVVASASLEAKARGIRTAMTIAQARRICPEAVFLRGNYPSYKRASDQMLKVIYDFSPAIEVVSLDDFYVDLTGFERLYGPPLPVTEKLRAAVKAATGLSVSIGIATNKLIAKMASDFAKPGGIAQIWPGYEASFISPMPIEDLPGVGPRTHEQLQKFNIHTIGQLAQVDEALMEATFGVNGLLLARRARGLDDDIIVEDELPKSISRETTFEHDTADRGIVEGMIYYLTERACKKLRELRAKTKSVTLKLRYSDFETYVASKSLPHPSDQDNEVYGLALALLDKLLTRRMRIRLVGVSLSNLTLAAERQFDLFAAAYAAKRKRLYASLDRIRNKHGFSAITAGKAINLLGELDQDFHGFKLRTACLTQ